MLKRCRWNVGQFKVIQWWRQCYESMWRHGSKIMFMLKMVLWESPTKVMIYFTVGWGWGNRWGWCKYKWSMLWVIYVGFESKLPANLVIFNQIYEYWSSLSCWVRQNIVQFACLLYYFENGPLSSLGNSTASILLF